MGEYCVYMHKNQYNNKVYIGMTKNAKQRWAGNGLYYCTHNTEFANDIRKYGWINFDHIILYSGLTKEEAYEKEVETIAYYKSDKPEIGYNKTSGGAGARNLKMSEEAKQKISESLIGHTFSKETLLKMSIAKKGKPTWNKGLKGYNSGDKNPMKRADVKDKFMGANNPRARGVIQYDMNWNEIARYSCVSDACRAIGKKQATGNIIALCNGKGKTAYGYKWSYIEEATE